jgi:hypothetical protein
MELSKTEILELKEMLDTTGWKIFREAVSERMKANKVAEHNSKEWNDFLSAKSRVDEDEKILDLIQTILEED